MIIFFVNNGRMKKNILIPVYSQFIIFLKVIILFYIIPVYLNLCVNILYIIVLGKVIKKLILNNLQKTSSGKSAK